MKFEIEIIDDNETIFYKISDSIDRDSFDKIFSLFMKKEKYELCHTMKNQSRLIITTIYDDLETDITEYSKQKFTQEFKIDFLD